ncbi:hypothetical protein ABZ085_08450, partial [Streptomyces albidoflavus]
MSPAKASTSGSTTDATFSASDEQGGETGREAREHAADQQGADREGVHGFRFPSSPSGRVLWQFRLATLAVQAVLWAVFGLVFGALAAR